MGTGTNVNPARPKNIGLMRAVGLGWGLHHKLSPSETAVLFFVATKGGTGIPGVSFVWHPVQGSKSWAAQLRLSERTLRHVTASLIDKGLIVECAPTKRFKCRGWGIPERVMAEVNMWCDVVQRGGDPTVAVTPTKGSTAYNNNDKQGNDPQDSWYDTIEMAVDNNENIIQFPSDPAYKRQTFAARPANLCRTTGKPLPLDNAVTRGNAVHSKRGKEERNQIPYGSDAEASRIQEEEKVIRESEDLAWAAPRDEVDDFSTPSTSERPRRKRQPTTVIAEDFHDRWLTARTVVGTLPIPWSVKPAFLANLKRLLQAHTEDEVLAMTAMFFQRVVTGQARVIATELWKDFLRENGETWSAVMAYGGADAVLDAFGEGVVLTERRAVGGDYSAHNEALLSRRKGRR
jgi:hypothetical protein